MSYGLNRWNMPTDINGVAVVPSDGPLARDGGIWHTLVPKDDYDDRIWEWNEVTNHLIVIRP